MGTNNPSGNGVVVKLLASTALLALALVLAAGCGGDDDDQSSSQAWADDFCSAAADWRSSLDDIISGFGSPSDLSEDAIRDAVDEGLDSTEQFLEDVEGLGTPDTEAGQEVNGIVDDMSASVQATVDDLRETLGDSSSLQDLLAAAPQAAAQLGDLEQELQTSLDELESVDTGELKSELDSNEDCAAAQSGSGS
jgi:hypothetical protein